jgi:hypothetical protein
MRKLATWLGIAAIALQIALPLLAGALPRSVALVPVCTVDGVTHYLEVPTGKVPLDGSAGHAGHCPLCCLGGTALAGAQPTLAIPVAASVEPLPDEASPPQDASPGARWARAPPFSAVVTSHDHELRRDDEEALLAGRDAARAPYRGRFLRLGVLHDQH